MYVCNTPFLTGIIGHLGWRVLASQPHVVFREVQRIYADDVAKSVTGELYGSKYGQTPSH
jgi:hypothetical protein